MTFALNRRTMVMLIWMVISKKPPKAQGAKGARCQEAELLLKLDPQDVDW